MDCPFCSHPDTTVRDSRSAEDGASIRRRRFCPQCQGRFTTYERVELPDLTVIKSAGDKQPFSREKVRRAVATALRKRVEDTTVVDGLVDTVIRRLHQANNTEIPSRQIGELIMEELKSLDPVAYVRFASVYKDFRATEDFQAFIGRLP